MAWRVPSLSQAGQLMEANNDGDDTTSTSDDAANCKLKCALGGRG